MKRILFALMLAALLSGAACALGEIGFAEVKKDNVNMRREPGGKVMMRLDAPGSVFVFEEKQVGRDLWCHVNTIRGKDSVDGWIRGDMLRFISDEFTDVVSVQAGYHYVTGVRRDGTVAIMGDDMPHMPCIETVRSWKDVRQASSWICSAFALDAQGRMLTVGRFDNMYQDKTAAHYTNRVPILLDEEGRVIPSVWGDMEAVRLYWPQFLEGTRYKKVLGSENWARVALTADGRVQCLEGYEKHQSVFVNEPYRDIAFFWNVIYALRADGRVDAATDRACAASSVEEWENVVEVSAGENHALGLKTDGTVYYAGDDARHAQQVAGWKDVKQVSAGEGYSIALMEDGSVVMAGEYKEYLR